MLYGYEALHATLINKIMRFHTEICFPTNKIENLVNKSRMVELFILFKLQRDFVCFYEVRCERCNSFVDLDNARVFLLSASEDLR